MAGRGGRIDAREEGARLCAMETRAAAKLAAWARALLCSRIILVRRASCCWDVTPSCASNGLRSRSRVEQIKLAWAVQPSSRVDAAALYGSPGYRPRCSVIVTSTQAENHHPIHFFNPWLLRHADSEGSDFPLLEFSWGTCEHLCVAHVLFPDSRHTAQVT